MKIFMSFQTNLACKGVTITPNIPTKLTPQEATIISSMPRISSKQKEKKYSFL